MDSNRWMENARLRAYFADTIRQEAVAMVKAEISVDKYRRLMRTKGSDVTAIADDGGMELHVVCKVPGYKSAHGYDAYHVKYFSLEDVVDNLAWAIAWATKEERGDDESAG